MSRNKTTFVDYPVYLLLIGFHFLSRLFPLAIWCRLGQLFGGLLYLLGAPFKRIALINLKFAYADELNDAQRRFILRKNFAHYGVGGFEWIRMLRLNERRRQQICRLIRIEGREHLDTARQNKQKIILLSGHFGHWEYATVKYASEINPLSFIVRRIDNPLVEQERCRYHEDFGARILYKENGLREAIRGLAKGVDLLLLADRKAQLHEGIPARFFKRKTSTLAIAVTLAQKYNAALVPMFILRGEQPGEHRLIFEPALDIDNLTLEEAVQLQNDCLERNIRRAPHLWLWLHRKWKCYHAQIYRR
ncbi:lysophospholipid acyltransferase family protein [Geopsychrobacter electrodiphilus]|uniref:lysophospholipid acyltransferase family protein n=1 Tax=Geopsychrobacter electrodiphilus TaxID=225196 RepID=UPI0003773715|nr:lysophospholipid acyltransferase family protein [Geopsychrobacter electrodiphilus]